VLLAQTQQLPRAQGEIAFLCLASERGKVFQFFERRARLSQTDSKRRSVQVWGWGVFCECVYRSADSSRQYSHRNSPATKNINELFNYSSHTPDFLANCSGQKQFAIRKLLLKRHIQLMLKAKSN